MHVSIDESSRVSVIFFHSSAPRRPPWREPTAGTGKVRRPYRCRWPSVDQSRCHELPKTKIPVVVARHRHVRLGRSSVLSARGAHASGGGATFTTIGYTTVITPGAPMNPFNATNNVFPTFDAMQLGWLPATRPNPNQELPGLASSWTLSPGRHVADRASAAGCEMVERQAGDRNRCRGLCRHLVRPGHRAALQPRLGHRRQPSTVTFTQTTGSHNNLFEQVLGGGSARGTQWIVPASEYGTLLPASIWSTIAASEGTGSAATAATTALTDLAKKIDTFAPKTDISAGPFYIKRLNNSEALLARNPYFYASGKIHVGKVIMEHQSSASQIYSYLEAGTLDAAPYRRWPRTPTPGSRRGQQADGVARARRVLPGLRRERRAVQQHQGAPGAGLRDRPHRRTEGRRADQRHAVRHDHRGGDRPRCPTT